MAIPGINKKLKYILICFSISISLLCNANATRSGEDNDNPWCRSLAYDGGGYWTIRLPIVIKNKSDKSLQGDQIRIILSDISNTSVLIGESVAALRVANEHGVEFFFELLDSSKERKRSGSLSSGDILILPVEADKDSTVTVYLYAGNSNAWLPPDIRDFTDNKDYSRRIVNEWLEYNEDILLAENEIDIVFSTQETRKLTLVNEDQSWIPGLSWEYRVPIHLRNFGERNVLTGSVTLNTKRIHNRLGKLYGFNNEYALCLIDPLNPENPLEISGSISESIRTIVNVPGLTEKTLWLYVSKNSDVKGQSRVVKMFSEIHDNPDLQILAGEFEAREKQNWPIAAWDVDPLIKVFRQDIMPKQPDKDIKVYAARNSRKSFQIALRSLNDLDATIGITPLKNIHGEEIPEPEIYKAGFVPVDFPVRYYRTSKISNYTRFQPDHAGTDGWQDWWPDPLIPIENNSNNKLTADNTQPIWFDIHIPDNTTPGVYGGHVIVESGVQKIFIPVEIKVWELSLPEKRHIPAIYDLRVGPGKNPFKGTLPDERTWSTFLSKYNVSPGLLPGAELQFTYKNGKVHMETKEFDKVVHFLIDELNNTMLYTPGFFYSVGWYSGAKPIFDLQPYSPEYTKAWKDAYSMFINHITKKGWRKNFVLYLSDEPRIPLAYNAIARVADMAKEVAPDVPIYVSSWDYIEEVAGHITAWGIGAQGQFPVSILEERKKSGDHFYFTTDGQQAMDTPFPATERLMPWFCFKYGVEAFEFWGSTWWTFNPWKYGWHAFYKESGGEQVKHPVRYPNGDGYLVYPGDEIGISDPVPSIRLIAVREGVDDFEIFHALDKFAEDGNRDAKEALDKVRSLVIQPHTGGTISMSFMPDPDAIFKARIVAGETLDRLLKK